jgi:hypothetical protein
VDDPAHPVAAGIPSPYHPFSDWTTARWMRSVDASQVGHMSNDAGAPDSLITAHDFRPLPVEVGVEFHDGVFKGHPTVVWVTATHDGSTNEELHVDMSSLLVRSDPTDPRVPSPRAEPDVGRSHYYTFEMDDTDGDGTLGPGESASWSFALIMPLGPPDDTYGIEAMLCDGGMCAVGKAGISTDSCKRGGHDPWDDELETYRHYQKAVVFMRTAWRNGDARFLEALHLLRQDTDKAFKDAHALVSNTSPGPGSYNLELIHENLDEGNCTFGVTGDWLKETGW